MSCAEKGDVLVNGFWNGRNVLVTGAGGFIGSCLAGRLVDLGANVVRLVGLDDLTGPPKAVVGDVTDVRRMCDVISSHEVDTVYHLAGKAIVRIAARDPYSAYMTNIMGTVSVLEACRTVGRVRQVVVASSDKAYGDHDVLPYREHFPLQPRNTYDTSKACADMVARTYAYNYGMPVCVTRSSNVYGPGDSNLSRLIPNAIVRAISGRRPMLYTDVASMSREFVYIDDVVDAYVAIGETDPSTTAGVAYNIGGTGPMAISSVARSIVAIVSGRDIVDVTDDDVELVQREPVFREIQRQYIDAELLHRMTGWSPAYDIQRGLRSAVAWYRLATVSAGVRSS